MDTHSLIEKHNSKYSTYYKGSLYTHTPMALQALKEMGATQTRIESFYSTSVRKLEMKPKIDLQINQSNWMDYLGQQVHEQAYVNFFKMEVQSLGPCKTIEKYFDLLMPGVGAAAFHPIIRLFYALRDEDEEEVAISLATWAMSYLDLEIDAHTSNRMSIVDSLNYSKENKFNNGYAIAADNIALRMQTVSKIQDYKNLSAQIIENELETKSLEKHLLRLFSQSNNFTLLHAVTSHQAFEDLLKFSSKPKAARILMWKTLLAAYLSTTGSVNIDPSWSYPKVNLPSWTELKKNAIQSNDEHVIKLVHVLSIKTHKDHSYPYQYAAALKLNMIEPIKCT